MTDQNLDVLCSELKMAAVCVLHDDTAEALAAGPAETAHDETVVECRASKAVGPVRAMGEVGRVPAEARLDAWRSRGLPSARRCETLSSASILRVPFRTRLKSPERKLKCYALVMMR